MRINSTWIMHHTEQVEAARAEFDERWPIEAEFLRSKGKSEGYIRSQMFENWIAFVETRVEGKYPGDLL